MRTTVVVVVVVVVVVATWLIRCIIRLRTKDCKVHLGLYIVLVSPKP